MLTLKLKEVLLAQGKRSPQIWLQKFCNLPFRKAYNLVNNNQKSIAFKDLSTICMVLECTPNDLFWWDNGNKRSINDWHPCITKLTKPSKDANWTKRIAGLDPESVEELKNYMETLEIAKMERAKNIHEASKPPQNEEDSAETNATDPID